ncbi:MAG: glycosyltransferase family 4 protein [Nitrososphaerales archaeon]
MPPRILIIADWYLPGYKAGGQVTAVANLVELFGNIYEFFVFTRDRDLTDKVPYTEVPRDKWIPVGRARVLYTADLSSRNLRRRIIETRPAIIYLNSFFSTLTVKTMCLRKLRMLPAGAIALAPRGEFSPGALHIKPWRKFIYRTLALYAGLYRGLIWQASSELEKEHIEAVLAEAHFSDPRIHVAWDLPNPDWFQATKGLPKLAKSTGARFLFISRISPMKNLLFALECLAMLASNVELDIFGPIDDRGYWDKCQNRINKLPGNVTVRYQGSIPRETVPKVSADHDFFLFPTLGENFGYVILEAMAAGCPVILSDKTPWQKVADSGAGWSLPLGDLVLWQRVLQECVDMPQQTYATYSLRAREYVERWTKSNDHLDETGELFNLALCHKPKQGN